MLIRPSFPLSCPPPQTPFIHHPCREFVGPSQVHHGQCGSNSFLFRTNGLSPHSPMYGHLGTCHSSAPDPHCVLFPADGSFLSLGSQETHCRAGLSEQAAGGVQHAVRHRYTQPCGAMIFMSPHFVLEDIWDGECVKSVCFTFTQVRTFIHTYTHPHTHIHAFY